MRNFDAEQLKKFLGLLIGTMLDTAERHGTAPDVLLGGAIVLGIHMQRVAPGMADALVKQTHGDESHVKMIEKIVEMAAKA